MSLYKQDLKRYNGIKMPKFQRYYRKAQETKCIPLKLLYKVLLRICAESRGIELYATTSIMGGLYFGHPYAITINPKARIGQNVNIHKGVTIGQENRGVRMGVPIIGNDVWIGINATIVGNIEIGNDVLIAPNTFVNFNVPDHSIVYGNPGVIKSKNNATELYINNRI